MKMKSFLNSPVKRKEEAVMEESCEEDDLFVTEITDPLL